MNFRNRQSLKNRVILSTAAMSALVSLTGKAAAQSFHNIALWDFNQYSPPNPKSLPNLNNPLADSDFSTSLGYTTGQAQALGMTNTYLLNDGNTKSFNFDDIAAQGGSTNPTGQSWRTRGFGGGGGNGWSLNAPNNTQGVQFSVDTSGESGIKFQYDWFVTGQGIADLRQQYTTDGTTWNNVNATGANTTANGLLVTAVGGGWLNSRVIDLSFDPAANNNPNLAVRLVSEKDPIQNQYLGASGGVYNNQSGNWRWQDVSFFSTNNASVIVPPGLTWNPGSNGTGAGNLWNKDTSNQNWVSTNVTNASFGTSNAAFFTDSGLTSGTGVVNVDAAGMSAASINVSHTNGTLTFTGGPISGKLVKTGAGNLVLAASGSNNFSSLEIDGGTLHAATDLSLGAAGQLRPRLTFNGATLVADNAITYNRFIIAGANGMTLDTGTNNVTFGGLFSAQGAFTKVGAGNLTFGTSSASTAGPGGFFTIQQGNVIFAQTGAAGVIVAPNALGGFAGNLIVATKQILGINGGTVDSTNGSNIQIQISGGGIGGDSSGGTSLSHVIINEPILLNSLNKPGVFKTSLGMNGTGNSLAINGVISGNSDVQFDGGKALVTLNQTAAYTGNSVINNGDIGVIQLGADNAISTGNLTFGTGTNNTAQLGSIDLNGHNQSFKSITADSVTVPNVFIAPGQKLGGIANTSLSLATLTISGTSSTIFLGSIGTPEFTTINGGAPANAIQLVLGASNTGSLTLKGPNDFNGGVVINGGTLQIDPNVFISGTNNAGQNSSALPDNTSVTNNASFIVNAAGFNNANATLTTDIVGTGITTVTSGASGTSGSYISSLTTNTMTQGGLVNNGNTVIKTAGVIGPVSGTGSLSIGTGAGTASVSVASFAQANVTVSNQAKLQIVGLPGGRSTSTATALTLTGTGQLDLGANTVLVDRTSTPFTQIQNYVNGGRNGGAWNGTGITSSFVASDPGHYGIAFIDGGIPSGSGLGIPANNVIVRPALIGDTSLAGTVNNASIRQIIQHGFYNDGLNTHQWSDGDFNGDGAVNNADIRAIIQSGNYNNGVVFATDPVATPSLSGRGVTPAVTTIGTLGDGKKLHYVYNPATGDVTVKFDGVVGNVQEFDLVSGGNRLIPTGANPIFASGFSTKSSNELDALINSGTYTDGTDLGIILPIGLTNSQLTSDLTLSFSVQGVSSGQGNADLLIVATPEPTTLSLLGLGAMGLMARRRRVASSKPV